MNMNMNMNTRDQRKYKNILAKRVRQVLEEHYNLDSNLSEKGIKTFFAEGYLPSWYFYSNTPEEIAGHLFSTTQLLNAGTEHLELVSRDGKSITYFTNVGRDIPGKLARVVEENLEMGVVSFDSVKSRSGIRIITLETEGKNEVPLTPEETIKAENVLTSVRETAAQKGRDEIDVFLKSLPPNYIREEVNSPLHPMRILRHFELYSEVKRTGRPVVIVEDTSKEVHDSAERLDSGEVRYALAALGPNMETVLCILRELEKRRINLNRSYFDLFFAEGQKTNVGIISLYLPPESAQEELEDALKGLLSKECETAEFSQIQKNEGSPTGQDVHEKKERETSEVPALDHLLEEIIRGISSGVGATGGKDERDPFLLLKDLVKKNREQGLKGDFLLNSLTDFMEAAEVLGIGNNREVLTRLVGFDSFNKFWVQTTLEHKISNAPGYRAKHSSVRGPNKGGIRIDKIVNFCEVAALSFMMTWKCARSRVLFGGGKGGLTLTPSHYKGKEADFFTTLSNFGRSLFLVTGPAKDVPAGDVGCGAPEIGQMFEGFKSALRDLALIAYGLKQSVALLGNKIISLREARDLLEEHFNVDSMDDGVLKELTTSEKYLELVAAPQITGKPRMGIQARTGATGRGLCYSLLAAVGKEYLHGRWQTEGEDCTEEERKVLLRASSVTGLTGGASPEGEVVITEEDWERLTGQIYPKLLKDKTVVIQGSGKVGSSVMTELAPFGVRCIAVADAGGAILGDTLNVEEMVQAARETGSIIDCVKGVKERVPGAREGAMVLELDCDILIPAALENAVTGENAHLIKAKIELCGSNGPNTSAAEKILFQRGVTVVYDFLANGAGVTASYFEWLRNWAERYRYEAEEIRGEDFNIDIMRPYLMPELKNRLKAILLKKETPEVTEEWNALLRDIMFTSVNEDYEEALRLGVSMKTAGFINTQLRVLTAVLLKAPAEERHTLWEELPSSVKDRLRPFFDHPEAALLSADRDSIVEKLYG